MHLVTNYDVTYSLRLTIIINSNYCRYTIYIYIFKRKNLTACGLPDFGVCLYVIQTNSKGSSYRQYLSTMCVPYTIYYVQVHT